MIWFYIIGLLVLVAGVAMVNLATDPAAANKGIVLAAIGALVMVATYIAHWIER